MKTTTTAAAAAPSVDDTIAELAKSMGVDLAADESDPLEKGMQTGRQAGMEGDGVNTAPSGSGFKEAAPAALKKGEGEGEPDGDEGDPMNKGGMAEAEFMDLLKSFEGAEEAMDASEFLKSMATAIGENLGGFEDTLEKSMDAQNKVNYFMAKGMNHVVNLIGDLRKENDLIKGMLEQVLDLPQSKRSVSAIPAGGDPLNKSFGGGDPRPAVDHEQLRKDGDSLFKAIQAGAVPMAAMATFDRTKEIPPQFRDLVKSFAAER